MHPRHFATIAVLALACGIAHAEREPGWEFGAEAIYQFSTDVDFKRGSAASLDDDLGLAIVFAYRFNNRFDLQFSLDWNTVDYDVTVAPGGEGLLGFTGRGDLESFTPRVAGTFNILEGDITPYITAGAGWAFIDTNIPNGPPETSCWWDPWWGYYCGTFQNTRSVDNLTYNVGAGVRWDVSDTITLKLGYNRNWLDLKQASGTPGFDQIRLGVYGRY